MTVIYNTLDQASILRAKRLTELRAKRVQDRQATEVRRANLEAWLDNKLEQVKNISLTCLAVTGILAHIFFTVGVTLLLPLAALKYLLG